jgi:hypothetical protein
MTPEFRLLLQVALFLCLLVVIHSLTISFRLTVPIKITARAGHLHPAAGPDQRPAGSGNGCDRIYGRAPFAGRPFVHFSGPWIATCGIEVTGTSGLIDRLAKELGIIPQKDASAADSGRC